MYTHDIYTYILTLYIRKHQWEVDDFPFLLITSHNWSIRAPLGIEILSLMSLGSFLPHWYLSACVRVTRILNVNGLEILALAVCMIVAQHFNSWRIRTVPSCCLIPTIDAGILQGSFQVITQLWKSTIAYVQCSEAGLIVRIASVTDRADARILAMAFSCFFFMPSEAGPCSTEIIFVAANLPETPRFIPWHGLSQVSEFNKWLFAINTWRLPAGCLWVGGMLL